MATRITKEDIGESGTRLLERLEKTANRRRRSEHEGDEPANSLGKHAKPPEKCALCNDESMPQINWRIFTEYHSLQRRAGVLNFFTDASVQVLKFPDGSKKQILGAAAISDDTAWFIKVKMNTETSSTFVEHIAMTAALEVAEQVTRSEKLQVVVYTDSHSSISVWGRIIDNEISKDHWERSIAEQDPARSRFYKGLKDFHVQRLRELKRQITRNSDHVPEIRKVRAHDFRIEDPFCIGNHIADIMADSVAAQKPMPPSVRNTKGRIEGIVCSKCTRVA